MAIKSRNRVAHQKRLEWIYLRCKVETRKPRLVNTTHTHGHTRTYTFVNWIRENLVMVFYIINYMGCLKLF